jgi:hypothetical protein
MKKAEVQQKVLYCNIPRYWKEVHNLKVGKVRNNVYEKNKVDKGPHHLFHDLILLGTKTKESTESKMVVIHDKDDDHKSLFYLRFHFVHLQPVKVNVSSYMDTMSLSGNSRRKVFAVIWTENEKVKVHVNYND